MIGHYTYGAGLKGKYCEQTTPVGELPANAWGLHDMHGNVWEWTGSVYDKDYGGAEQSGVGVDEPGDRVVRGGSWDNLPHWLRSACRNWNSSDDRFSHVGFRVARFL